jgi:hypothetical protein
MVVWRTRSNPSRVWAQPRHPPSFQIPFFRTLTRKHGQGRISQWVPLCSWPVCLDTLTNPQPPTDEQLLAAAKQDSEELLRTVLSYASSFLHSEL